MLQQSLVDWAALLRNRIKGARKKGAFWVRVFDILRLVPTLEGKATLWTTERTGLSSAEMGGGWGQSAGGRFSGSEAGGQMPNAERADAPARCNHGERLEDEAAFGEPRMGDA